MIFLLPVEVDGTARLRLSAPAQAARDKPQTIELAAQMNLQQHQRDHHSIQTDYIVD